MTAKIVRISAIALVSLVVLLIVAWKIYLIKYGDAAKEFYLARLDHWVATGGDPKTIQQELVENCGKLVSVTSPVLQTIDYLWIDRAEYDFRVDVCVKITANRLYPQPEFQKPELVKMVCHDGPPLFTEMCERNGIQ